MSLRKNNATNAPAGDAPGITLEKIVARIQQMMDPNSVVKHNEQLKDRVDNTRQYDIVIRGHFGGRQVLGVMECKDHCRKEGPGAVEAFAKKSENLGANLRIMVSRKGFTEQALRLAKYEHIGCISLLPASATQVGFSIGDFWYGILSRWEDVRLTIHFPMDTSSITTFNANTVKYDGKQFIKWFLRELITNHGDESEEGEYALQLSFDQPRQIEIDGLFYPVSGFTFTARRVHKKKRIWFHWSGDAFYDWHTGQITIPPKGVLVGSFVDTDLTAWPDFDGEIPVLGSDTGITALLYGGQHWDISQDDEVPDLSVLHCLDSGLKRVCTGTREANLI